MSTKVVDPKEAGARSEGYSRNAMNDDHAEIIAAIKASRSDFTLKHSVIVLSLSFLLMFATALGILAFTTRGSHNQPIIYTVPSHLMYGDSTKASSAATMNPHVLPNGGYATQSPAGAKHYTLEDIPNMPLTEVSRNQVIALQWGATGSGEERKYLLYVDGVSRDASVQTTTLTMSSGHTIAIRPDSATLFDKDDESLGVIEFASDEGQNDDENSTENDSVNPKLRKLVRYGKEKHGGGDFFDGYCRYGCSQMGVTFPYYYRPFFGYGYPLVGTEGFFPAGYGGNPVTELAANGVLGGPAGMPGAGMPGVGMPGGGVGMGPMMAPGAAGATPGMAPF